MEARLGASVDLSEQHALGRPPHLEKGACHASLAVTNHGNAAVRVGRPARRERSSADLSDLRRWRLLLRDMSNSQKSLSSMSAANPIPDLDLCAPENRWFDAIHHAVLAPSVVLVALALVCVIAYLWLRYASPRWAVVISGAIAIAATIAGGASLVVWLATC